MELPKFEESIDEVMAEYLNLNDKIKELTERRDSIRDWCKENGSFCTDKYVCSVVNRSRTGAAPLSTISNILKVDIDQLLEVGVAVNTVYSVVSVSKKGIATA